MAANATINFVITGGGTSGTDLSDQTRKAGAWQSILDQSMKDLAGKRVFDSIGSDQSIAFSGLQMGAQFMQAIGQGTMARGLQGLDAILGGGGRGGQAMASMASGGAGAAGGMGAAVLPYIAVVEAAATAVAAAFNNAARQIAYMGEQFARVARDEGPVAMFTAATEHMAQQAEQIPILGGAIAAQFRLLGAPLAAFQQTIEAFVDRGKLLEQYSGPVASARAEADIRRMFGDIREADRIGPAVARLTDAQSRLYDLFREIMLPVKEVIVNVLVAALETGLAMAQFIRDEVIPILKKILDVVLAVNPVLGLIVDGLSRIISWLRERFGSGAGTQFDLGVWSAMRGPLEVREEGQIAPLGPPILRGGF